MMLEAMIVLTLGLWLSAVLTSFTLGGFIHALLLVAAIAVLVRVVEDPESVGS